MFCKSCGAQNDDDAQYCVTCGLKVAQSYTPEVWRDATNLNTSLISPAAPQKSENPFITKADYPRGNGTVGERNAHAYMQPVPRQDEPYGSYQITNNASLYP